MYTEIFRCVGNLLCSYDDAKKTLVNSKERIKIYKLIQAFAPVYASVKTIQKLSKSISVAIIPETDEEYKFTYDIFDDNYLKEVLENIESIGGSPSEVGGIDLEYIDGKLEKLKKDIVTISTRADEMKHEILAKGIMLYGVDFEEKMNGCDFKFVEMAEEVLV